MAGKRTKYFETREEAPVSGIWDGVRIGSESCSRLIPSIRSIQSMTREGYPGSLSLVTPIAGPDEIGNIMSAVNTAVSEGWGEIVVNDWGVLSGLSGLSPVGRASFTAGRLLMRFRRGPGACELTDRQRDEPDPAVRRYFAWGPLYDSAFLAFLKANNIGRIELDLPRHWMPVPEKHGFRFSLHKNTRFISITGQCPWLYDPETGSWGPVKRCTRPCREISDIVMYAQALKRPMFLRGRAILERVEADLTELALPDSVDRIIHDQL
jgi:hypothetical protein